MSAAIETIAEAVYAYFTADQAPGGIYAALGGRLYFGGSAPSETAWPYAVYTLSNGAIERVSGVRFEELVLRFDVLERDDPSGAKVDALLTLLRDRFDRASLVFSGGEYDTLDLWPQSYWPAHPANPAEQTQRMTATMIYRLTLQQQE